MSGEGVGDKRVGGDGASVNGIGGEGGGVDGPLVSRPVVIALDGPAGVGKSTVGERVGRELGYFYFDTGILYRAVALGALDVGLDLADEAALDRLVREFDVVVCPPSCEDGRQCDVLVNGADVSHAIRTPRVDAVVSRVAASPAVRAGLIDMQRRQVQGAGSILAGRDIGTVVCPDADLKVFLTAGSRERALRRLRQRGGATAGDDTTELAREQGAIEERDRLDSTRSLAPLTRADDAVEIHTEGRDVEQVVEAVIEALEARLGRSVPRVAASGRAAR